MPARFVIATLLAALAAPVLAAPPPVTVVELFQSQGCSSCPPANANVNALIAARPDVLALSFAVTYWDQLGWKDGFATRANTQRQWDYAKGLHHDNVWTPQVVVNGRSDLVGANASALADALKPLPTGAPALALNDGTLAIGRGTAPRGGADVWLVRYDPRTLNVAVKAGENGGKTLPHRNIVRSLTRLGGWTGTPVNFGVPAATPGLATAILLQSANGGPILAATRS
ncbi:DUF1223 domain-containing protein [Polymorphobacter arshaanensis]|uniref:DUF1223 domain-containing protein n=1 Tax=Glacieibacterium arshaanense TaxID=2511025 RepID=A0A4Y9ELB7_9SPHN|nr:DUF1223 domain-containing protein [Polymorphobacter arshaanensis]TFU01180.1 DUF1223 domain-containing protein [Polymorphobacter arshaanensis]